VRTVAATVSELIYAGPTTRITAHTELGVDLTATVLTASTWLPPDLHHGTPVTLAWPEKAVQPLTNETRTNEE
jgi:putative spermidine/putrescine transport system ATP-binding protein